MTRLSDNAAGRVMYLRHISAWRRALPARIGTPRGVFANPAFDLMVEMALARLKPPKRPLSVADLAYLAELPKNTAARHIHALAAAGIVQLEPHPTDGRARTVSFTRDGWERALAALESLQWVPF